MLKRMTAVLFGTLALIFVPLAAVDAQGYGGTDGAQVSDATPAPGQKVELVLAGFAPNTDVALEIRSDPIALGTFRSDASGVVRASVTIPEGFAGNHTIVASGVSATGQPLTLSVPVVVAAAEAGPGLLALTGSDSRSMVAMGALLLVVGGAATVAAKKRMADES